MVARLGDPPADIIDGWCHQLRIIASHHEQETGDSFPDIELGELSIGRRGELSWRGQRYDFAIRTAQPGEDSLASIRRFHDSLTVTASTLTQHDVTDHEPGASRDADQGSEVPLGNVDAPTDAKTQERPGQTRKSGKTTTSPTTRTCTTGKGLRRLLFTLAGLACVIAACCILYQASRPARVTDGETGAAATGRSTAEIPSPARDTVSRSAAVERPLIDPLLTNPPDSPEAIHALETIESLSEAAISSLEAEMAVEPSLSLEDLMPSTANFVSSTAGEEDDELATTTPLPSSDDFQRSPPASNPATDALVEPAPANLLEDSLNAEDGSPEERPQRDSGFDRHGSTTARHGFECRHPPMQRAIVSASPGVSFRCAVVA